mgnify:CR=1 FL=1
MSIRPWESFTNLYRESLEYGLNQRKESFLFCCRFRCRFGSFIEEPSMYGNEEVSVIGRRGENLVVFGCL